MKTNFKLDWLILPLVGIGCVLLIWSISSATWAKELPSPAKTWEKSKDYIVDPFAKRGEMDQGILRFTWYSLLLVPKDTQSPCSSGHRSDFSSVSPKRSPKRSIRSFRS